MRIAGADLASNSGLCVYDGQIFCPSSFRPKSKRNSLISKGDIDPNHNARVVMQFRDHFRAWLLAEQIEYVGIEDLLRPTPPRIRYTSRPHLIGNGTQVKDAELVGGSNFTAVALSCALFGAATEICTRLNIPFKVIRADDWRKSFIGVCRAPRDAKDGRKWLKERVRQQCQLLGIPVSNDDMSDACGICWHLRGWIEDKTRPDLFGSAA